MAVLAVATYLLDRLVHQAPLSRSAREIWLVTGLASWALITTPFSYNPGESWSFLLNNISKTLAIFFLLSNVIDSTERLRKTFWLLTLIAVPLGLTALEHFFSDVYLSQMGQQRIVGYDAPLTGNPNDLALTLNLIVPLMIALLLMQQNLAMRIFLLAAVALSWLGVILTFSRAGFLTLAALLLLYLWKLRRRPERRWAWAMLAVIAVCIPLVGPSYMDRLSTITNIEADKSGSAQERWADMTAAAAFIIDHPFIGAGIGQNVHAVREERGPDGGLVHNVYLECASELGLVGLAIFLLFYCTSIKSAASVQRRAAMQGDAEMTAMAEAIQLSLIAFGVAAMFHPVAYHMYLYYFAGLAVAAKNASERSQDAAWKQAK